MRPGVVRVLDEHLVEGAARVGEAAEIEERDGALVARVQIVGHRGQRGVEAHERLARAAEIVERLPLEQRQPRHQRAIGPRAVRRAHALESTRAAPRVLEAGLGVIVGRRQSIDVEVGGAGERLGIVGIERERAREGRLGLVEAAELLQRGGAVVVRLDRARLDARRLFGADERAGKSPWS